MCTTNEGKPERLTKDKTFFKVCVREDYPDGRDKLITIHNREVIHGRKLPSNKPFRSRRGYQVFETRNEAHYYRRMLLKSWTGYTKAPYYVVRPVEVRKGALKARGEIKAGYICSGRPVLRVSSGTIGGE